MAKQIKDKIKSEQLCTSPVHKEDLILLTLPQWWNPYVKLMANRLLGDTDESNPELLK